MYDHALSILYAHSEAEFDSSFIVFTRYDSLNTAVFRYGSQNQEIYGK